MNKDNQSHVEMLSPSVEVSMGEQWFQIANENHFWIKRRFDVFLRLSKHWLKPEHQILDVGCGTGIFGDMLATRYASKVDGADLNVDALKHSGSTMRRRLCYDINQKNTDMHEQYDAVTLFDVIEHIEDDRSFLESALWHLKPGGHIIVNVPALECWRSEYDDAVGHKHRYNISELKKLFSALGLSIPVWSYWAAPLIPFLIVRKMMIRGMSRENIIERGFRPPSKFFNWGLGFWCSTEPIPNHVIGASVMLVAVKN